MWHLTAAMLGQEKLFKDGALTCSLHKALGGVEATHKRQNRWEPLVRVPDQGAFGWCKCTCSCHTPQLIPLELTDGSRKDPLPVKSIGHIAVRQGSKPGNKKLLGFVGFFLV